MARWEPDAAGRLMAAAMTLFTTQGYAGTTVAEITAAAGLTKRTFFRHFPDKRDVLFHGSDSLRQAWVEDVSGAPDDLGPLEALQTGHDTLCRAFDHLHEAAAERARLIAAHPELSERELLKLEAWAAALAEVLIERGVGALDARLAALVEISVFRTAFDAWVATDDPASLRPFLARSTGAVADIARSLPSES